VDEISKTSIEALCQIKGIGPKTAETIYKHFNQGD